MSQSLVIPGSICRLYINNTIYNVAQSFSYEYEAGEYEIRGIDSPYPQEIAGGGSISIKGSVSGVRLKNGGGLQAQNARPLFSDVLASPYISIRLDDRRTGETLISIPNAKISNIKDSVSTKGIYRVNFSFTGQVAYFPLDLS
jgi:hypothetical protein